MFRPQICLMFCLSLFAAVAASARANEMTAVASSTEISMDENVSIEFRMVLTEGQGTLGAPQFEAPDFEEVNSYARNQSFESRYINGKFESRRSQSVVTVLHPKKSGKLAIRHIRASIAGNTVSAPDIIIDVLASGANRQGHGGGGSGYFNQGQPLPRSGLQRENTEVGGIVLRTEPNKLKAYKGEQIILTYAVYVRVPLVNVQVERFPTLPGFLKEDIDIPTLRNQWDFKPAVINGREYRRAVLAQYAIFPVKDGLLPLDSFTGKFAYRSAGRMRDDEDPFGMLNQFFQSMQTASETRSSNRVSIEVSPLPASGQPANFSGLVGDFEITAVVDKYTTKVGDPINVKVKVEGRGHAGLLEKLPVNWPADFELYEDKSSSHFYKTGRSEKLFEYMLVPKVKGKFELPPIELTMFNPETKAYQSKKTAPFTVDVLEGSLGNVYVSKPKDGASASAQAPAVDIRYWKDEVAAGPAKQNHGLMLGLMAASLGFAAAGLGALALPSREGAKRSRERALHELRSRAGALGRLDTTASEVFGEVENVVGSLVELQFGITTGSMTRAEIRQALGEKAGDALAARVEKLLELCENQRYAPGGGELTSARAAAEELGRILQVLAGG